MQGSAQMESVEHTSSGLPHNERFWRRISNENRREKCRDHNSQVASGNHSRIDSFAGEYCGMVCGVYSLFELLDGGGSST